MIGMTKTMVMHGQIVPLEAVGMVQAEYGSWYIFRTVEIAEESTRKMVQRRPWWLSRRFLHGTYRRRKKTLTVFSPHFYMARIDVGKETNGGALHFYIAHADVRKETLVMLSPHFYMAHANVL